MKKRLISFFLTLVLLIAVVPTRAEAAQKVSATVASFKVTLNGVVMDNTYAQYPLIVYKDITYFPMTYYDCRFMAVKTDWDNSTRTLSINAAGAGDQYHPTTRNSKNSKKVSASVVDYNVIINGKKINNVSEPYPLLSFRDVTYFPMTWRFCVEEFGWTYSYTKENGLIVDSGKKSKNVIAEKETISITDVCEFYVDYTDITDDVRPPQPDSWYSHYVADDGKVYVDICVAYKNLAANERMADEIISATLIYGGKYQYTGFSMIEEDSRGDFTYSSITSIAPLSTEYLHYLFEVPAEVENSNGALKILLNIEGHSYTVIVREGTEGEVASINKNSVVKTSGTVKKGEMIAIPNHCEFYVDYTDITDDVMPPQPDSWYSHYVADDGKMYVDFCVGFKNWKTKSVMADDVMSAVVIYAGKYNYNGFSIIEEDSRGDFTYCSITSIDPLSTEYLHYLFEVPAEVANSGASIEIKFVIGGNTYYYKVR